MVFTLNSQGVTRVVDELFAYIKGRYMFIYLKDQVVCSRSVKEPIDHVPATLRRLQVTGFILNPDKMNICPNEVKYIRHSLSSRGIIVLSEILQATYAYPCPQI